MMTSCDGFCDRACTWMKIKNEGETRCVTNLSFNAMRQIGSLQTQNMFNKSDDISRTPEYIARFPVPTRAISSTPSFAKFTCESTTERNHNGKKKGR